MSARFITRVASVLPSELFGRATGSPLRRFVTRTYASSGLVYNQTIIQDLYSGLERETGFEPATNSLEGYDSTTELLPPADPRGSLSIFFKARAT